MLLKLSGEILAGPKREALDLAGLAAAADHVEGALTAGVQLAVVLGGGNILRGTGSLGKGFSRVSSDAIGMVATLINAMALQAELDRRAVVSHILSSFAVARVAELHTTRKASEILDRGQVVLFAGGTGNPYFTTDTAAALRALETGCDIFIKGTKVAGVYSEDPERNPNARLFGSLTCDWLILKNSHR